MMDPNNVPEIEPDEGLARYILQSSHIRRSDQTIRPDAFIPHPYQDLSVTRHRTATETELWFVGFGIAAAICKTLYGRGDFTALTCLRQKLAARSDPTIDNPNHANISGWPADKPAQKIIAQEIAATAVFVAVNQPNVSA